MTTERSMPQPPSASLVFTGLASGAAAMTLEEREWEPGDSPVCPECAAEKHANCDGTAWDNELDCHVACECAARGHSVPEEPELMDTQTAADHAGLSYRQVDYWVRAGYVECEQGPLPGSGRRRYFTPAEVRVLVLMAAMTRAGWLPAEAAVAARTLVAGFPVVLLSRPGLTLSVRLDVSPV